MNPDVRCASANGLLTLLALRGIGPQGAERIAARFATLGDVREASQHHLATAVSTLATGTLRDDKAWETAYARALLVLEQAHHHSVRVLTAVDTDYPPWLREIPDRPPVIYVKGTLPKGRRSVACIGTREPSRFGELATRRITEYLAEHGWSIVSGLALGIDTLSHRCALDSTAHTVAVLANGLESVYPKKNKSLAHEILDAGGAWLSEQPFGAPAIPRNLVSRDRLQSGMSAGTIVMQTGVVGGSMHTVRFTLLQGRLLFAPLPFGHHADELRSQGNLALAQTTGPAFSELLNAEGQYRELLHRRYHDRPPAVPLNGSQDYPVLLELLEKAVSPRIHNHHAHSDSQLGLF